MTQDKKLPKAEVVGEPVAIDGESTGHAPTAEKSSVAPKRKAPWFRIAVIVIFGLFYAYDLIEAISNTFGVVSEINRVNEYAALIGTNTSTIPWTLLIANMLTPLVVFGLGLLIARKRNVGILAIVLLAGLGVVGVLTLSFIALSALGG